MVYREVDGDLIKLAKEGKFDVIVHGCNCQCIMKAGIAPQMAKAFGCDSYKMELPKHKGEVNKLGTIDYGEYYWNKGDVVYIVNAYTQFDITGRQEGKRDLDYEALTLCLRKINYIFKGKHIGLPRIGAHLAGGDWNIIQDIIKSELKHCTITVVNYKPENHVFNKL